MCVCFLLEEDLGGPVTTVPLTSPRAATNGTIQRDEATVMSHGLEQRQNRPTDTAEHLNMSISETRKSKILA